MLDLCVLGGGPVGSLLAALVRRQDPGRQVLVLEKARFPRHHVGESTIPSWRPILERAGVLEKMEAAGFMPKVGTLFHWGAGPDESWTLDFRDPATGGPSRGSFQVDRARLDQLLLEHARSTGAEVHEEAEVQAVEPLDGGGFRVRWQGRDGAAERRARFVVDATGQARLLTRLWRLGTVPFDDMNNFAVWGYWRASAVAQLGRPLREGERWTFISTSDDGWVWHIPIAPDLVSVGLVTEAASLPEGGAAALEPFYRRNVASAPGVAPLLERAELVAHPLAPARLLTIRDWSYRGEQLCGPGWFLTGDAGAFVDPILSSGLLLGASGASMVANALHTLWCDPAVDEALLRESYQAACIDMAESYHALARVWYARNFKSRTWHWEAKRQRLSTGRDLDEEAAADAFLQLCIGSFTNPVEGAFAQHGLATDLDRADAHIYRRQLFGDADGLGRRFDEASREGVTNEVARELAATATARRWRRLIGRRARLTGCTSAVKSGYFTDGTMGEWRRVRYVEVAPEGPHRPHDRVVFPSLPELPEGLVPHLDGARPLGEVLRGLCAELPVGTAEYETRARLLYQQATQLSFRAWLAFDEPDQAPADAVEPAWPAPPPLVSALAAAGVTGCAVAVGVLGETLDLTLDGRPGANAVQVMPTARAGTDVYRVTRSTSIGYRGRQLSPVTRDFIDHLERALVAWERAEPAAAVALWSTVVPSAAGQRAHLETRDGHVRPR